jgi:hypothetical protein
MLTYISYFIQLFLIVLTFRIIYIVYAYTHVIREDYNSFKHMRIEFRFFPIEIQGIITFDTRANEGQYEQEEREFYRREEEIHRANVERNERAFRAA